LLDSVGAWNYALSICGWVHVLSVAEKFRRAGFTVEVNVYVDKVDDCKIRETPE
jgi:hypothetical protein